MGKHVLRLTPSVERLLMRAKDRAGLKEHAEVFRHALALLDVVAELRLHGARILIEYEDGSMETLTPSWEK